jgi:alkanesulfonate monooxygenase SsuD/methylene tetrahydromethanopterin reductase-like flavin-dependent oxidoreductase (luciferase family)
MSNGRVGIQLGATTAPKELAAVAREAENFGYSEIWMAEDYFQLGGVSSVATALAATERIPIGLGVVAAAVRHPAATAMEFATLGAVYPERFMAGLGHGAPGWVRQMGLQPESPLGLLREATHSIRQLLEGEEVTRSGDYFSFDRIRLHHSPTTRTPIYLGVHGPASLRLSGELADGTLLGWFSSPGYVAWARQRIEEGRARADRQQHHQLAVLCLLSISEEDPAGASRDLGKWATPMLSAMGESPQLRFSDEGRQLSEHFNDVTGDAIAPEPPDGLLREFVAVGDQATCAATIERLLHTGADRVVLVPNPAGYRSTSEMVEQMRLGANLFDA